MVCTQTKRVRGYRLEFRFWSKVAGALAVGSLYLFAPAGARPPSEESQVIAAMEAMYGALEVDDSARLATLLAPDFYAFDGGRDFKGMELAYFIRQAHASGKVFRWTVTKPSVHLKADIAWITYENVGSVGTGTDLKAQTWLESAVLRKQAGRWRIMFLHSTRVAGT